MTDFKPDPNRKPFDTVPIETDKADAADKVLSQLDSDIASGAVLGATVGADPKPKRRGPAEVVIALTSDEAFELAQKRMAKAAEIQKAVLADGSGNLNQHLDQIRQAQALLAVADPDSGLCLVAKVIR